MLWRCSISYFSFLPFSSFFFTPPPSPLLPLLCVPYLLHEQKKTKVKKKKLQLKTKSKKWRKSNEKKTKEEKHHDQLYLSPPRFCGPRKDMKRKSKIFSPLPFFLIPFHPFPSISQYPPFPFLPFSFSISYLFNFFI